MPSIATVEELMKDAIDSNSNLEKWTTQLLDLQSCSIEEFEKLVKEKPFKISDPYEILDKLLTANTMPFYFTDRSFSTIILCLMICIEDSRLNKRIFKARKLMLKLIDWMHHRYDISADTLKANLYLLDDDMLSYWEDIIEGRYKEGMVGSGLFVQEEYDDLAKRFGKINIYEELKAWLKHIPKNRRKILESYLPYLKANPLQRVVFGSGVGFVRFKTICMEYQQKNFKKYPNFFKNAMITGIAILFEDN